MPFSKQLIEPSVLRRIRYSVNPEIFARVLFLRNFAYAKFREIKSSRNEEIILSFTDIML